MSKTNHRVNKDQREKLAEPRAHKTRRSFKQQATTLVDLYDTEDGPTEEIFEDVDWDRHEKITRNK